MRSTEGKEANPREHNRSVDDDVNGSDCRDRTCDAQIFNLPLYLLS